MQNTYLEGEPGTRAVLPVANMFSGLLHANVILRQVLHDVHHDEELLAARLLLRRRIDPHARYNLYSGGEGVNHMQDISCVEEGRV